MVIEVEPWIRRVFLESSMAGRRLGNLSRYVDKGGGSSWEVLREACVAQRSQYCSSQRSSSARRLWQQHQRLVNPSHLIFVVGDRM